MKPNILNLWKVRAVVLIGWIEFVVRHLVLVYYWINVVYYWLGPMSAYHLSYEIEMHIYETYAKYLAYEDYNDKDIWRIMNDEIQHFKNLQR